MEPEIADELRAAAELADRHYHLGAVPLACILKSSPAISEASMPFIPLMLMLSKPWPNSRDLPAPKSNEQELLFSTRDCQPRCLQ